MSRLDDIAEALAEDVLKAVEKLGDDQLIMDVAKVIGASSTPTEEAFLSAVRVRQAEARARRYLKDRVDKALAEQAAQAPGQTADPARANPGEA